MAISNKDAEVFDWWNLFALSECHLRTNKIHFINYYTFKNAKRNGGLHNRFVLNIAVVKSELLCGLYG